MLNMINSINPCTPMQSASLSKKCDLQSHSLQMKQANNALSTTNGVSQLSPSLIPLNHKRVSKIKRYNKKLESITSGKSKELHHVMKQHKLKRDLLLNYYRNDLKNTLFLQRENAQTKQSLILAENKQQNKLLIKRIIGRLNKIKEKLIRDSHHLSSHSLRSQINEVFITSVENVNYSSSRRITRNRAKNYANCTTQRSKKNIDLTRYKFGLNPTQIGKDLRYLIAKETQKERDSAADKEEDHHVSHGFNYDNYHRNNNISLGLISTPVGFLNDRHLFESQLTGVYYKKTRSKRTRTPRNTNVFTGSSTNEHNTYSNPHSPQKCRFEAADDDTDYVVNENEDGLSDESNQMEQENAVIIDGFKFKANCKIKIIETDGSESYGVIHRVMKYHIKVMIDGKIRRFKYKEINNGYVNVFPI
eukprot:60166_1